FQRPVCKSNSMIEAQPDHQSSQAPQSKKQNPFFPMVLCSATIFILTILAMVAVIFSDPRAPVAKFLDAHAGRLIVAEVIVTLFVGLCALVVDRLQTRRRKSAAEPRSNSQTPAAEKSPQT